MDGTRHLRFFRIFSIVVVLFGVAVRVIELGRTPPGLNQDEASIGYEAWSLLHYGIDRNGVSWPVHLISWGSGQNALYAYIAMPFVLFGLSPTTIRLPMLISGLASLLLLWIIARRLFDERAAWAVAVVAALCPWHIMLSRWALESNILPFVFLCGLTALVISINANRRTLWLGCAGTLFGLSLYAYGTAYLAVPLFIGSALLVGSAGHLFTIRQVLVCCAVFAITAFPITLFILVNLFQWNSLSLSGVSVPRLPTTPRFETQLSDGGLLTHIQQFWQLLETQQDGTVYNVTDPYGVLYSAAFFFLAIGFAILIAVLVFRRKWPVQRVFVSLWIVASLPIGIVQEPNINRINILLMGMVFSAGLAIAMIDRLIRGVFVAGSTLLLVLFGFFVRDYFTTQREKLAVEFSDGLLSALQYARTNTRPSDGICITAQVNMPYIYALFSDHGDPREYLNSVQYAAAAAPFRQVVGYGRYTFGLDRCDMQRVRLIVARTDEKIPEQFTEKKSFSSFRVYSVN
jgi:hypothetical protein